jgi:hypothetical protein
MKYLQDKDLLYVTAHKLLKKLAHNPFKCFHFHQLTSAKYLTRVSEYFKNGWSCVKEEKIDKPLTKIRNLKIEKLITSVSTLNLVS